jgi:hypothetical protein
MLDVIFIMIWGAIVWEVVRRTIIFYWIKREQDKFGGTIEEYRDWKHALKKRNG